MASPPPRLARRLTMADVAVLLGWTEGKHPARAARERLRRLQDSIGVRILYRGGGSGNPTFTTYTALRHAGLLDDFGEAYRTIVPAIDSLAERLTAAEQRARHLARALQLAIDRIAALESGTVPPPNGKGRRKGRKRRKRAPDRLPPERRAFPPVPADRTVAAALANPPPPGAELSPAPPSASRT